MSGFSYIAKDSALKGVNRNAKKIVYKRKRFPILK